MYEANGVNSKVMEEKRIKKEEKSLPLYPFI